MKKKLILLFILLFGIQVAPIIGQAADSMKYSVSAVIPENQIDKTLTYFDLKMIPNQKQDIDLVVSNSGDEEQTIIISPNVAKTNQNGVIDYSQSKGDIDSSLIFPLKSIISEKQEVKLAPKEKKTVTFTLEMPEKEFNGLILGGFYISTKEVNNKAKEAEKDVQIKNNYSYVIGIKLRENTNEVKPDLKLNQIKPALLNYRTAITANLQNIEATIIKDLSIDAKVMKKGNSDVLHETLKKDLSMAPNSNFDFPINWDNQSLEPGNYTLQLTATSGENKWNFEEDFNISSKESSTLNKEAVELEKAEPNWLLISLIILVVLLLLIMMIGFLIYRYKKKKAAEKRARLLKKRKRKQALIRKKRATEKKSSSQKRNNKD
ncbi:DUF916 and DUF3324 domain-containing protein [Carnobacterium maltaromaticum]|uniref:DUF916 and DUF3324 domain-containing protein n=1 Tax=Carnobacterium maltaromaticum TaxID=2751 RepID=UPI00295EF975|nr:DUF916 and DUF3324 domain-containing protein [Carnobacterium maltaromaticum]